MTYSKLPAESAYNNILTSQHPATFCIKIMFPICLYNCKDVYSFNCLTEGFLQNVRKKEIKKDIDSKKDRIIETQI